MEGTIGINNYKTLYIKLYSSNNTYKLKNINKSINNKK